MPHLHFAINRHIPDATKVTLAQRVRQLFAEVMYTGTDHISISIHECGTHDLSLGRVQEPEKGIALVDADLRKGRTLDQRRTLALGFIACGFNRCAFLNRRRRRNGAARPSRFP